MIDLFGTEENINSKEVNRMKKGKRSYKGIWITILVILLVLAMFLVDSKIDNRRLEKRLADGPKKICWNETFAEKIAIEGMHEEEYAYYGYNNKMNPEYRTEDVCGKLVTKDFICEEEAKIADFDGSWYGVYEKNYKAYENCGNETLYCFKEVTKQKCKIE